MISATGTITKIEERFTTSYVEGSGIKEHAKFKEISIGWWITIDKFYSFPAGSGKPDFAEGDFVTMTIAKR